MTCPRCNHKNHKDFAYCEMCGQLFSSAVLGIAHPSPGQKLDTLGPGVRKNQVSTTAMEKHPALPYSVPPARLVLGSDPAVEEQPKRITLKEGGAELSRPGSNPVIHKELPPQNIPGVTKLVLIVFNDAHPEGQIFALSLGIFKIGSGQACEIQIEDNLISKMHGLISVNGQGALFMDTSARGTSINNRLVQGRDEALQLTSVMLLGQTKIVSFFVSDHVSNIPWK